MPEQRYVRFRIGQRIEHILLILSFMTLVITGLPQKYAGTGWAEWMIANLGGIQLIRVIHRFAATMFTLEIIYHVALLAYKVYVLRVGLSMLPGIQDVKDFIQGFLYNLGFAKVRPKSGRYSFDEKAEYWALVWGSVVMILTGFALWNPIATSSVLPGQFIPAAKAAHGGEALLAFLAILVWHFYHVHIKLFNKSIFTGTLTRKEMEHEHPLELEAIDAGQAHQAPPRQALLNRRKYFYPIAGAITLTLLGAVYYLFTFEQTAVSTLPPLDSVEAFSPQTPTPLPTAVPQDISGPKTWNGSVAGLFDRRCAQCHGEEGGLSVETYQSVMQGGANGKTIISGNANTSPLIVLQASGSHPGKFSPGELQWVKDWINAGAPEE